MSEEENDDSLKDLLVETQRVDSEMARLRQGLVEFENASLTTLRERLSQLEKGKPDRVTRCELAKDKAEDANSYLKIVKSGQIESWKLSGGVENLKWRARMHVEKASSAVTLAVASLAEAESTMLEATICERQGAVKTTPHPDPEPLEEWEQEYQEPTSQNFRRGHRTVYTPPRFPKLFRFLRWQ